MRITLFSLVASTLLSLAAYASPEIISVAPDAGPLSGGTTVVIKGNNFNSCPVCSPPVPPVVFFGSLEAASTTLVDEHTITAVTPPSSLPFAVNVTVVQWDGSATLAGGFRFGEETHVAILLPIYSPPVPGIGGSLFETAVNASNRSDEPVTILGIDESCFIITPPGFPAEVPRVLEAGVGKAREIYPSCSDWPGRLMYVPESHAPRVSFNVRVHDVSRNGSSHGTEIPVVRLADFSHAPLVFSGVPDDGRFRPALRIYGATQHSLTVTLSVNGIDTQVTLQAGRNAFEPAYAFVNKFPGAPVDGSPYTITVTPPPGAPGISPPVPGIPAWAFITVTNNQTQEITTITPDLP